MKNPLNLAFLRVIIQCSWTNNKHKDKTGIDAPKTSLTLISICPRVTFLKFKVYLGDDSTDQVKLLTHVCGNLQNKNELTKLREGFADIKVLKKIVGG